MNQEMLSLMRGLAKTKTSPNLGYPAAATASPESGVGFGRDYRK